MNRKAFIECLFDIDDKVAWGKDDAHAYYAKSPWPDMLITNAVKFCINPLDKIRNTENVTAIYSMLFEMDKDDKGQTISKETQIQMFNDSCLPYSTMVWSGTKSVHVIVRLTQAVPEDWFKPLWRAVADILEQKGLFIDRATMKVPQLSRVPNSIRDNGEEQTLICVKSRVNPKDLTDWIKANGGKIVKPKPPKPFVITNTDRTSTDKFALARKWTEKNNGIYTSSWQTGGHMWLFQLGVNACTLELDVNQTISLAMIEWGTEYMTSAAGKQDISVPIIKGWNWCLNNKK